MALGDYLRKRMDGMPETPDWKPRPDILLHGNIPKPLHGVAPRVVLGKKWWDEVRRAAYRATDYHCAACGIYQGDIPQFGRLEGHEIYRTDYARGRMVYVETVALCYWCHAFIHMGRTQVLFERREISYQIYRDVLQHGKTILLRAGLRKPKPYAGREAAWTKWRLVVGGKEYPPNYKSYAEWCEAWGYGYVEE